MSDYQELIDELRTCAEMGWFCPSEMQNAADAIEQLTKKRDELVGKINKLDERPHGHWLKNVLFYGTHTCSNCGKDPNHFDGATGYVEILSDFCPNCGAKMDEEIDDEIN